MRKSLKILPLAGHFVAIFKNGQNETKAMKLNRTAAEILNQMQDGVDAERIAQWLSGTYQIPLEQAMKDVLSVAEKWSVTGATQEVPEQ
ncbi:MAG: PqqD family protein [Bacteroidales bacterium]|nr:PqqD family protein [Bacteroidales bacterium]